jgi:hypothetical protein
VVLATSLYKLWYSRRPSDVGYGDLLILLAKSKLANGEPFQFIGHSIASTPDIPYYLSNLKSFPKFLHKPLVKMMFNSFVTLGLFCEGDVAHSNRLTPSKDCDHYGIPQVDISYHTSETSKNRMKKMALFGRKVLRRASATRIIENHSNDGTGIHYAGTCRMGVNQKHAIVDANLKTIEHDNLYLCDGGVIPHLPDKHLTLTIMALAEKLACHLINRFSTRGIQ